LEQLERLDERKPVPLQPLMAWHQKQSMMEHLGAIERITQALADADWDGVARAAAPLESSPDMQQTCRHLGAGADGFTDLALDFHRRADAIGEAARAHDTTAVLRATANTLQACTGCHATFRQHVVSAEEWERAVGHTSAPHPGAFQRHGH
jgi:cytochrome c556